MKSVINSVWFLIVALCLILTVGSAVNRISSSANATEEISFETAEDEAPEKLHQRRRKNAKRSTRPDHPAFTAHRPIVNFVAALNRISFSTERCRMNGFGGYLRN